MRLLNIFMGLILAALGFFCIANAGLAFISMAFPIGVVILIAGLFECISYKQNGEDAEDRHWVLIEGITTFLLGLLVLSGNLAADVAVVPVFGMWCMISGIRNLVIMTHIDIKHEKNLDYYWTLLTSLLNGIVGLYAFFNARVFALPVLMLLGILFIIQAFSLIKVGIDTVLEKSDLIKTKEEMVAEATEKAEKAKREAKKALKAAKKAKRAIKEAEETEMYFDRINKPIGEDNVTITPAKEVLMEAEAEIKDAEK